MTSQPLLIVPPLEYKAVDYKLHTAQKHLVNHTHYEMVAHFCTGLSGRRATKETVPAIKQPNALYENIDLLPQSSVGTKTALYENIEPLPQSSIEMKECPAYGVVRRAL